jgi:hypothetical protein
MARLRLRGLTSPLPLLLLLLLLLAEDGERAVALVELPLVARLLLLLSWLLLLLLLLVVAVGVLAKLFSSSGTALLLLGMFPKPKSSLAAGSWPTPKLPKNAKAPEEDDVADDGDVTMDADRRRLVPSTGGDAIAWRPDSASASSGVPSSLASPFSRSTLPDRERFRACADASPSWLEPTSPSSTGGKSRRRKVGSTLESFALLLLLLLLLLISPKLLELPEKAEEDGDEDEIEECACELSRATLARLKSAQTKQK